MATKEVALEIASFLDSPQAAALAQPPRDGIRKLAEAFFSICYEELGKKPNLLDGHDVHTLFGHLLPGHLKKKDPLASHAAEVMRALFTHLEETQVVTQIFEMRNALEATAAEFEETVRTGHNVHHGHAKQDPFQHKAPKLGRNDPCSCGSGKKYKKCHGKNA